ncbi:ATP-binding cassette domain-containing protein [Spiroplasma endosymbiont of Othius punctulatus]|uniref:ABC transporter ATP-binding protein n=1 Tax=Spiroplasma endosymbiont of Othius punctulatus TaxID=3066289 RepID=UPI0030CF7C88
MSIISVKNLTKVYKNNYGIHDINIEVDKGTSFGFLGPNGAGKSTTIRHLMGYIKADKGTVEMFGTNVWKESHLVQPKIGYLPGEITFPEQTNGLDYIKMIFSLREQTNWEYVEELIQYWQFNPDIKIKKMSKGMKQKVALIIAFMHNPELLILDEPTTGLDPLMQQKFIDLVISEKAKGTTVFISSHIFAEIEKTCDQIAIVKSGKIVSDFVLQELVDLSDKRYVVKFSKEAIDSPFLRENINKNVARYKVPYNEVENFFKEIKKVDFVSLKEVPFSLEKYFMDFYDKNKEVAHV